MSLFPPIYALLAADPTCQALLGGTAPRVYPAGDAPETVAAPYVTWQIISSVAENVLDTTPPIDNMRVQVNCWGTEHADAENAALAVRNVLEQSCSLIGLQRHGRDWETRKWHIAMDFSYWLPR